MRLRFGDVGSSHEDTAVSARERRQLFEAPADESLEVPDVFGCIVEAAVAYREPERWNFGSINSLPREFSRRLGARNSSLEPVGLHTREFQDLRHLRIMAEGVQPPSRFDFVAEPVAEKPFTYQILPRDGFPGWDVLVMHGIGSAGSLELPFPQHLTECGDLGGVAIAQCLAVAHPVQHRH